MNKLDKLLTKAQAYTLSLEEQKELKQLHKEKIEKGLLKTSIFPKKPNFKFPR